MSMRCFEALVGVLADEPVLECTRDGGHRFVARIVPDPVPAADGEAADFSPAVYVLVADGLTARRAFEQFTAGDHLLAVGVVRPARCGIGSGCRSGVVFEAAVLGHDLVRSRYAVDRTRRRGRGDQADRRAAIERELELAASSPSV